MTSEAAWIRGIKEAVDRGTVHFIVISLQTLQCKVVLHKKLKSSIQKNHNFCSFYFWDSDRMDLFTEPKACLCHLSGGHPFLFEAQ